MMVVCCPQAHEYEIWNMEYEAHIPRRSSYWKDTERASPATVAAAQILLMSKKGFWRNRPKWKYSSKWRSCQTIIYGRLKLKNKKDKKKKEIVLSGSRSVPSPPVHSTLQNMFWNHGIPWTVTSWTLVKAGLYSPPEHVQIVGLAAQSPCFTLNPEPQRESHCWIHCSCSAAVSELHFFLYLRIFQMEGVKHHIWKKCTSSEFQVVE